MSHLAKFLLATALGLSSVSYADDLKERCLYGLGNAEVTGFWEKFVCLGAGTCGKALDGVTRKACTDPKCPCAVDGPTRPSTTGISSTQIHLPGASYMVIQSGSTTSVIQTAK